MNKSELIEQVAKQSGVDKRTAGAVLNGFEEVVQATLKTGKEKISWTGFLTFEQGKRGARNGRNPQTGAPLKTKAKKVPKIGAGATLKKITNGESPAPKLAK